MTGADNQVPWVPELLILPPAGSHYAERTCPVGSDEPLDPPEYDVFGSVPVEPFSLFWYRWIAGHQIAFILWRTIGDLLEQRPDRLPGRGEIDLLTTCIDGYSAMLLYSATTPGPHYHADIRRRMSLQHPSFSGAWAPDYRPVRRLFRGRFGWQQDPSCAALREAIDLNRRTHDHIADHLVPDGRSLLQNYVGNVNISREKEDLFDNFFMTIRRPIDRGGVVGQLAARIRAVGTDLESNGLFPLVDGRHYPVFSDPPGSTIWSLGTRVLRVLSRAVELSMDVEHQLEKAR